MTLFRRGNVFWAYVYVDGVRHAKSTGTTNRRQAEQIEQRFKDELNLKRQGMSQLAPETTFGELAARFLAEGQPRPYHLDRLKMLLPYFAGTPIGRITKNLALAYRKYRHSGKRISDTTVNRDLEALRSILFWAVDEGLLSTNPLSRVRMTRERKKPRFVLSVAEEELLLQSAAPHLRAIVVAALDTGMRRGEILSQRWEHVDINRQLLSVTHSKTPEGEAREVPLTGRLLEFLRAQRKPEGLVFTFKGQPIHKIKTAWMTAIRRAGIRYYRFHDLRHCFNCRLMEAGVLQEVRKALMGHSTGEGAHSTYIHVELPIKRDAIRKLEAWVLNQRTQLAQQGDDHEPTRTTADNREPAASAAGALPGGNELSSRIALQSSPYRRTSHFSANGNSNSKRNYAIRRLRETCALGDEKRSTIGPLPQPSPWPGSFSRCSPLTRIGLAGRAFSIASASRLSRRSAWRNSSMPGGRRSSLNPWPRSLSSRRF
jgi:integrase